MKNDDKTVIYVNKKYIIIILVAVCLLLLGTFLIDDYPYLKSLFRFDNGDEYTAKAIEAWDQYGCSYFYLDDRQEALANYESILEDEDLVEYVKNNSAFLGFINLYSDKDIENALNAIVYGCNDSRHATGKYRSVSDIPERLFRNCYLQMIMFNDMNKNIKEVYEQYLYDLKN